jgi:hypothetical protein
MEADCRRQVGGAPSWTRSTATPPFRREPLDSTPSTVVSSATTAAGAGPSEHHVRLFMRPEVRGVRILSGLAPVTPAGTATNEFAKFGRGYHGFCDERRAARARRCWQRAEHVRLRLPVDAGDGSRVPQTAHVGTPGASGVNSPENQGKGGVSSENQGTHMSQNYRPLIEFRGCAFEAAWRSSNRQVGRIGSPIPPVTLAVTHWYCQSEADLDGRAQCRAPSRSRASPK